MATAQGTDTVGVSLRPAETTLGPDEELVVDVVVEEPTAGVAAFDVELSLTDDEAVHITDALVSKEPLADSFEHATDWLRIEAAQGDNVYEPADEHVLVTVSLETRQRGTAQFEFGDVAISDEENEQYTIAETTGASIEVIDDGSNGGDGPSDDADDEAEQPDDGNGSPGHDDDGSTDSPDDTDDQPDDTDDEPADTGGSDDLSSDEDEPATRDDGETADEEPADGEAAVSDEESETADDNEDGTDTADDDGAGFDAVTGLLGIGGIGYLLKRRLSDSHSES